MTSTFEARLKAQALGVGFDLAGITTLGSAETSAEFEQWLANGYHGEMDYLARGAELRRDSRSPEPGMRSAVVVALDYGGKEPDGPVARYARGDDYHRLMWDRLEELLEWARAERPSLRGRAYVDTGPVLERDLARRAGIGWVGKNTMLINPARGSFFFLGALFLDIDLVPDAPFAADHCGTCTRCLEACPTQAFVEPRVMDARRCISYLTIEHRSEIPQQLAPLIGEHLYGCDVCQDVCPWNVRFAREVPEGSPFSPRKAIAGKSTRSLARDILEMSPDEYAAAFRHSPMKRAKLRGLKRNAAVVLGNVGSVEDVSAVAATLSDD